MIAPRRANPASSACVIALLQGASSVAACSHGPQLEPAQSASTTWQGAARAAAEGVRVVAEGDTWAGDAEIREHVTPVQLRFENGSAVPLGVRYSALRLISADGRIFKALPPFDTRGTVERTVDRLVPGFKYRDVAVAPYLGPMYDGIEVEPLGSQMDYAHDHDLYRYWNVELPLPTPHMREVALPEGVVRPGGEMSGFVYFERVPDTKERVTLTVDLVNAETSKTFGSVSLPFVVD